MKHSLDIYLEFVRRGREKRRRMVSALLVLSLVVTAVVAWNLRLDSVAATVEAFCGYEKHTHTESCVLDEVLGCDGTVGHVHSVADCFTFESVLSCVSEEHVHGEDCYNAEGESICSKFVHTHSDACYTKEAVLVCEVAEGEHVHTEACYEEKWSCGLIEHVHTAECFSNTEADVETAKIWEDTLPELSGYWAEDTASIAISQVGYAESDVNFILGDNNEKKYYSRYGQWFGHEYGDWNVMFAEFCLYYAGVTDDYIPMSAGANSWQTKLESQPYYFTNETKAEGYVPSVGSVLFIDLNADGAADKVAVLTGVSDGFYNTVEGDLNGVVGETMYALDSELVIGYLDTTLVAAAYGEGAVSEEVLAKESVQNFLSGFSGDTKVNFKYMSYLEKYDFIEDDIEGTYILSGIIDTTAANNGGSPKLPTNAAARAGTLKTLALPLRQVRKAGFFTNNDIGVTAGDNTAENFYFYELGTKTELDELYNGTNDVHLWSGTSVSTNDKLGTNDSYDLTAIWVQKTKDLKLDSASATTDATSKNWKDWTVYCLDEYYQETDVQISLVNVAEGKPVKIESADGSSFSAITYLTAGPDYVLQPVTSVTAGKDYVFVNKKTGKVLTNTIETGYHWYLEGKHVLLGSAPIVDSDKWSLVTYNDGFAIKHPDGGYLTPNTVNVGLNEKYEWGTPVYFDYNTTEAAFEIYRTGENNAKYKLVACHDGNGNYVYAIGCNNSDFDSYSYWEIYETVKSTHTVAEAISTHNQTAVTSYLDKYGVLTNGFSSVDYEKPAFSNGDNGVNGKFDCIKVGGGSGVTASLGENRIYYTVDLIDTYEKISYFTFDVAVDTATAKTTGEGFMLHNVEVYDDENGWTEVSFYQDNIGNEVYKRDAEYVKCRYTYVLPEIKSARYVRFTVGDNSASGAINGGVAVGEIKVYSTEQNRVNYALNTAKISIKSGTSPAIIRTKYNGATAEIGSLEMKKGGSYERALMIDAPFLFDGYTALNTATANAHEVLQKHRALTLSDSGNVTIEIDLTQEAKKITELVLYSTTPLTVSTVQSMGGWDSNTNLFSSTSASRAKTENFKSTMRELWDGVATRYVYFIDFTSPIESAAILRVTFENKEVTLSEIKVYGEPSNEINYALGRYVYLYNTGVVNSTGFKGDSTEPFTAYSGAYFGIRYDNADNANWKTKFLAAHTFHTSNYALTNGVETGDSVSFALKNSEALDGAFCTTSNAVNFQGAFNKNRMVFVVDLDGKKNGITEVSFFVNHKDDSNYEFNIRSVQAGLDPDGNFVRGWINGTAESTYPSLLSNLEWSDVANGQIKVEDVTGTWKRITYSFTSTEAEYIRIEAYSPKYIQVGEIEVIGSPWVDAAANKSVEISFSQAVSVQPRKSEGTWWHDKLNGVTGYSVAGGLGSEGDFDLDKNILTDDAVPLFGLDDTLLISSATANNKATFKIDLGQVRNVAQVEVYTNDEDVSKWNASGNFKYEKIEVSIDGQNWEEATILQDGSEAQGGNYSNYSTAHYGMCYVTRQYAVLTEDYEARYIKITGKIDNDSPYVSGSTTEYRCHVQEIKVNCLPIYENNIAGYYNGREGHVIPVDTINDLKSMEFLGDSSQFEYENGSDTNVAPIYDSRTGKVDKVYVGDGYTVIYIYTPLKGTFTTEGDMYDYRITSYEWHKTFSTDPNAEQKYSLSDFTAGKLVPLSNLNQLFLHTAISTANGWRGTYSINANYNFFTSDGTTFSTSNNGYYTGATKSGAAAANGTNYKARIHFGNENNSIGDNETKSGLSWIKWKDGDIEVLPNLSNSKLLPNGTADYIYQQGAYGIAAKELTYKDANGEYQLNYNPAFDNIDLFNGMYGMSSSELASKVGENVLGKIAYDFEMKYVRNGDKLTLSNVTGIDRFSNGQYSGLPGGTNGIASDSEKLQYLAYVYYLQASDKFAALPTNNLFPLDDVYFLDRMMEGKNIGYMQDANGVYVQDSLHPKGPGAVDDVLFSLERKTGDATKDSKSSTNFNTFYEDNTTATKANVKYVGIVESDDFFAHNHFFGMHDELKFTIPEDYCGPLEFFFYGDDDMWVYLDGQLICDIGGVHQAIAEYVNLWDYIDTDSNYSLARSTGSEEHTLSIFYTERGAYGSTCYVSFTVPVASTAPRAIGVSKEAVRINNAAVEDVYDDNFTFNVNFYDAEKNLISEIPTDAELSYIKTLVNGETQVVKLNSLTDDILLKSGESFIMQNLPESFVFFSVEETGASGSRIKGSDGSYVESADNHINYYTTSIEATGGSVSVDGRTVTYVPIDAYNIATVRFTNIPVASELPETGGEGIMWFMLIGFALTVIPMGAGIFSTVKKAKRFLAK